MYKLDTLLLKQKKLSALNTAMHLGLHLSTNAEKETCYIQYGQLLFFSMVLYLIHGVWHSLKTQHSFKSRVVHWFVLHKHQLHFSVFPKVNWSGMDIRSSKEVQITGPSIKFTWHSHTPQRRYSDSYWSFGPAMNNILLDQTSFSWTLPHVWRT